MVTTTAPPTFAAFSNKQHASPAFGQLSTPRFGKISKDTVDLEPRKKPVNIFGESLKLVGEKLSQPLKWAHNKLSLPEDLTDAQLAKQYEGTGSFSIKVGKAAKTIAAPALALASAGSNPSCQKEPVVIEDCINTGDCEDDDTFTAFQPYTSYRDISGKTSSIITEGGQSPIIGGYGYTSYDDNKVLEDLNNDWDDNNLPGTLRAKLTDYYENSAFKNEVCRGSGDMARILLGGFKNPVTSGNMEHNKDLEDNIKPEHGRSFTWNDETKPEWAPDVNTNGKMTTYKNVGGVEGRNITVINKGLFNGADPDNIAPSLRNEDKEYDYSFSPPAIAQAIEDNLEMIERLKLWADNSVKNDQSPYGMVANDQRVRWGLTGFESTAEKESLLNNKFGLWQGAKTSNGSTNFLQEGVLNAHPSINLSNLQNNTDTFNPGDERLKQFKIITGKNAPNSAYDIEAYNTTVQALKDILNSDSAFQQYLKNNFGPLN